jgi:hypothetical protein
MGPSMIMTLGGLQERKYFLSTDWDRDGLIPLLDGLAATQSNAEWCVVGNAIEKGSSVHEVVDVFTFPPQTTLPTAIGVIGD